jgi:hypothetical protein
MHFFLIYFYGLFTCLVQKRICWVEAIFEDGTTRMVRCLFLSAPTCVQIEYCHGKTTIVYANIVFGPHNKWILYTRQ